MTRAAIYARFSSEKQREESIEDQIRVCRQYAEREGYEIAAVYSDEARSGTSADKREGFQRMVRDAQRTGWSAVIVYKMDRFARNRFDSATYKAKLRRAGTKVLSATEGIPDGPEGIILDSMLEGLAEYYSANLSQNVLRGMEGNALRCMHNGVALFGYRRNDDGTYSVNEDEAPAVRKAFAMVAAGVTRAEVADKLNARGYRTIRGKLWKPDTVVSLIRNEKYVGVYKWGDVRVEGGMPAIVDSATFSLANDVLARTPRRHKSASTTYLLSGLIYDVDGNRMEPNCGRSHGGEYHYYYRSRASKLTIRRDDVEGRVRRAVASLMSDSGLIEEIVGLVMAEQEREMGVELSEIQAMESRISEIGREMDRLIDLAAKGAAPDLISSKIAELGREEESIRSELDDVRKGAPKIEPDFVRFMLHRVTECEGPDAVVRGCVSRVVVAPDRSVWIGFTISPDGTPPDGTKLIRVNEDLGHQRLISPNRIVGPGFFLLRSVPPQPFRSIPSAGAVHILLVERISQNLPSC
ncbi:hypothetical protein B5G20_05145 [Collinsella sp. An7]|uniref:recombinase family protein n=1 Tax=Collinsella sp. An7 TaxID=1965651 RepID=UPI000B392B2E|nr:recombinase family protein [Collinsella sp. An7]OUN47354.1 hypothetical protein B5G20_05145 [Collinsella sp. An7]